MLRKRMLKYFMVLIAAVLMIFETSVYAGNIFSRLRDKIFGFNRANDIVNDARHGIDSSIKKIEEIIEHERHMIDQMIDQKLDKSDGMVKKHLDHIDSLERRFVIDAEEIIDDVFLSVDSKIERINSIVEKAITDANELEKNFFADLDKVIKNTECAADKILTEYFAEALGGIGRMVGTHVIRIFPPLLYSGESKGYYCVAGYCAANHEVYQDFNIKAPNFSATYDDIKKYLLDRLDNMRADTPIDSVIITYSILSELARRTICFHPGVNSFVKDYVFFREKIVELQEFIGRQGVKS